MRMVRPKLVAPQVSVAEDQEEFKSLTAALIYNPLYEAPMTSAGPLNTMVLAFKPNDDERARLAAGQDIYVSLLTFMQPMQAIIVTVGSEETAAMHSVPEEI